MNSPSAEQIREQLLARFQRQLRPPGWLSRKLFRDPPPPSVGYVREINEFRTDSGQPPQQLQVWRITESTIEWMPADTEIPAPRNVFDRLWDIAHFTFTLPDDSGCGTHEYMFGDRYGSAIRYRAVLSGTVTEIHFVDLRWQY